jgi:inner membrane protein
MTFSFLSSLTAKLFTIGLIAILLLFPLAQVHDLVRERAGMRELAVERIGAGWGGRQVIGAPILAVPFEIITREPYETNTRQGEKIIRTPGVWYALAAQADVRATLKPQIRHLGIYSVPVYESSLQLSGSFDARAVHDLMAEAPGRTVDWQRASIVVPVADVRGIREVKVARWADGDLHLEPAAYQTLSGVGAQINVAPLQQGQNVSFRFELGLAGSQSLRVLPLAQETTAQLTSSWPHPNFSAGAFLPARYTLDDKGFDAHWQVLDLNRGYPQSWRDAFVDEPQLLATAFGVDLYQPVDTYQRNERAIKYALLFIAITLMSIFLWEHATRAALHPMQYLLVGLALCVFYLLLLALSEHVLFGGAYLMAATALVALVGVYLAGVLRSRMRGAVAATAVGTVYGLLYLLILSEQYALLLGAVLIFAVLATIMVVTRRLDWRSLARGAAAAPEGH